MSQNTRFSINKTLNIQGRLIDLSNPCIMGVLNVTPDSFFDGGKFLQDADMLRHVEKMLLEGALFIDVGAYSSRPGAKDIPVNDEVSRAVHAVSIITRAFPQAMISIDTFRSKVAWAAVQEGAVMVNDISGGELDPVMHQTVSHLKIPYTLMHMRGTPQTMRLLTGYQNILKEVIEFFHRKIHALRQEDVHDIIIDPGFGFAKTAAQNFELLSQMETLGILSQPILVGLSRKSMIWKTLKTSPEEALNGTTSLNTIALLKGANILRVHDVKEAMEVIRLVGMIRQ